MSSATRTPAHTPSAPAVAATETVLLAWEVHRLREEPERIPRIAAIFAATVIVWWLVLRLPLTLPVPLLCLITALNDYLFPMRFRVTDQGVHSDCGFSRLFIAWSDVKRATRGTEGIYLSPFARPSRLEAFRGVRLRFSTDNAEQVTALVRARWHGTTTHSEVVP
jgi:hypothetical protein